MNVGDLVMLSSYGRARFQNEGYEYGYGIIITKTTQYWDKYPLGCAWYNYNGEGKETEGRFHPRELKRFKPDKN